MSSRDMGRATATGALLLLALTACSGESAAVPDPPADGNVLDVADVLTPAEEQELEALIDERNNGTDAARVAVLTIENAEGSIEDFARDVAATWGVGDEGAENGVLIVADTEERELRIETADGVRESFSDDDAEDVIDDVLGPAFADDEYAEGLTDAVDRIYLYAQGQRPAAEPFDWALFAWIAGGFTAVVGGVMALIVRDVRRRRRLADDELRAATDADPDLHLTEKQRADYRRYRYNKRDDSAVNNPAVWLPLYLASPGLYSGRGTGSSDSTSSGSSFNGGGGFTGGGASGSY